MLGHFAPIILMGLFDFFRSEKKELFSGGPGDSLGTAVILNTSNPDKGIAAESQFISAKHGTRNRDWKKQGQSLVHDKDRHYDAIDVQLSDGQTKRFYFDITQFYGR